MTDTDLFRRIIADIEFKEKLIELTGTELGRLKDDLTSLLGTTSRDVISFPIAAEVVASPSQPIQQAEQEIVTEPYPSIQSRAKRYSFEPNPSLDLEDLPGELWRPIPQSDGYWLSNMGRAKRVRMPNAKQKTISKRIIKQTKVAHGNIFRIWMTDRENHTSFTTRQGMKRIWGDGA